MTRLEEDTDMLVLTRRQGEKITIGQPPNQVVITVVDIDHNKIRLGIEAPPDVPIRREEIPAEEVPQIRRQGGEVQGG